MVWGRDVIVVKVRRGFFWRLDCLEITAEVILRASEPVPSCEDSIGFSAVGRYLCFGDLYLFRT